MQYNKAVLMFYAFLGGLMKIESIGLDYRHPKNFSVIRPSGSTDNVILIIKTASYVLMGEERILIPAGSALILRKGTPHVYGSAKGEFINDWIHFESDESYDSFIESLGIKFDCVMPLDDIIELTELMKRIFWEHYSQNLRKMESEQRYLDLFFLKLSEKIQEKNDSREHSYYHKAFCDLRGNIRLSPQKDWSLDEISKELNLSRSYVQHLYKSFFGTGIIADIQANRMEYAKYLLSSTELNVYAISRECGYSNDVHFMRIFKKAIGLTPTEYRQAFKISEQ